MTLEKRQIGVVGVDSGQIMVVDPCYIDEKWTGVGGGEFTTLTKVDNGKGEYVNFDGSDIRPEQLSLTYDGACLASLGSNHQLYYELGHAGAGVCVGSGYGDGVYPVYGEFNGDGRCLRLTIDFGVEGDENDEVEDEA